MRNEIERFLESKQNDRKRPKTIEHYGETLDLLHRFLLSRGYVAGCSDFPIRKVTSDMLIDFSSDMRKRKLKNSTVINYTVIIKEFFEFLKEAHKIKANPSAVLHCVREKRGKKPTPKYNLQSCAKLAAEMDDLNRKNTLRDRAIYALFLASGTRAFQVCSLDVQHLDQIRAGTMNCIQKGGYYDDVEVASFCVPLIEAYLKTRGPCAPDDPLFISQKGNRITPNALWKSMAGKQKALDLPTGLHVFKGQFATESTRKGGAGVGRDLSHHQHMATTDGYVQTTPEERRQTVESLEFKNFF